MVTSERLHKYNQKEQVDMRKEFYRLSSYYHAMEKNKLDEYYDHKDKIKNYNKQKKLKDFMKQNAELPSGDFKKSNIKK